MAFYPKMELEWSISATRKHNINLCFENEGANSLRMQMASKNWKRKLSFQKTRHPPDNWC